MGNGKTTGDIMTIEDVAAYLRLGRRAVYRLAQTGELPGRKILNRWRFHLKEVEAWVRAGGTTEASETRETGVEPQQSAGEGISQRR